MRCDVLLEEDDERMAGANDHVGVPAAAGARHRGRSGGDPGGAAAAGVVLDYVGDARLLDVHVRGRRRRIERDPDMPECVLTVRGSGDEAARPS